MSSNNLPMKPSYDQPSSAQNNNFLLKRSNSIREKGEKTGRPPRCPSSIDLAVPNSQRPPMAPRAVPTTPNFATAERARHRNQATNGSERKEAPSENYHFHAQPVNRRLLASPTVGVKKQKPQSPTRPIEFKFELEKRAAARPPKATPVKDPVNDLSKCFKALPMRVGSPDHLPPKRMQPNVIPKPFQFETDRIDAKHKEKLRQMAEKEERERRDAAKFRANGMPNFNHVFIPVLGEKRFTQPDNFQLNVDRRKEERKDFDEQLKAKEQYLMEVDRQRAINRQKEEEEERRKLREALVHRPQPYKNVKPFEIKHDYGQITVPKTPHFHIDRRLLERPPSRNRMDSSHV